MPDSLPTVPASRDLIQGWYVDHHRWLQGWLRRRMGNAFDAADIAHDTYERLLGKPNGELGDVREPRAFLTQIAKSLAANAFRRRCVEEAFLESLAHVPEDLAVSPEQQAIVLQALIELDRHLEALPAPVRQAFLMSQVDEMKQADIAEALGLSLATVKRHIARAVVHVCLLADAVP
ncbi:RNA polymerase sigma-70 factor (ECF subfamily) [Comamonas sp. BIGb0124]|uniref:sigma-70 family RNA polymerase sigma factor n=1 Tax=Comamonas sp. BIGb0124 TaxID=2485130 RepID=UPI000F46176B|nr:sigma-70 family RNA polymerase sigma factor [Comamonas sp. BIGb0124]ROR18443.1 RNA polymerase sigma-70 factor (ECF subfamily) [Comamonas sp. BIGb0124]